MDKPKFEFYERPNGHNEFIEFFEQLPEKDQKKMLAVIANVEEHGNTDRSKNEMGEKTGR